jgi:hypothetical protein
MVFWTAVGSSAAVVIAIVSVRQEFLRHVTQVLPPSSVVPGEAVVERPPSPVTPEARLANVQYPEVAGSETLQVASEEHASQRGVVLPPPTLPTHDAGVVERVVARAQELKAAETTWVPKPIWREVLSGVAVVFWFDADNLSLAAEILRRFEALGANVQLRPGAELKPVGFNELRYPFSALDAAQAIQAALVDLRHVRLESTGNLGTVELTIH